MSSVTSISSRDRLYEDYKYYSTRQKEISSDKNVKNNENKNTLQKEKEISSEEQKKIEDLKKRDTEVKVHEQAHISAGGSYIRGGPHYQYTSGPDGKKYVTGGDVSIDTSEVPNDPSATIQKAQIIRSAALAPAEPSSADRAAASQASQMEMKANQELLKEQTKGKGIYTKDGTIAQDRSSKSSSIDIQI